MAFREGHPYLDPRSIYQRKYFPAFKDLYGRDPASPDEIDTFATNLKVAETTIKGIRSIGGDRDLQELELDLLTDQQKAIHDEERRIAKGNLSTIELSAARARLYRRRQQIAITSQGRQELRNQRDHLRNVDSYNRAWLSHQRTTDARNAAERRRATAEQTSIQRAELAERKRQADRTFAFQKKLADEARAERERAEKVQERETRNQVFSTLGFTDKTAQPKITNPLEPLLVEAGTQRRRRRLTPLNIT